MDIQHIEKLFGCIMERLDRQEQMLEDIRHKQRADIRRRTRRRQSVWTANGFTTTKTFA